MGKLFVFSAPSGSGKTTIVKHLVKQENLALDFSISATSRAPREGEIDGDSYHFISAEKFKSLIEKDAFIEWEEVYTDNYYGTLKTEIDRIWTSGKHVIFDIDVVGGLNIKKQYPEETLAIFVKPPSMEEMERRLRGRQTETEEKIKERLAKASKEFEFMKEFDEILVNDSLEKAKEEAEALILKFSN